MRQLLLGNLNYSSWSIRPLLVARRVALPVEEVIVPLDFPETSARLKAFSPTARVPLLIWDELTIWDSLAITEWIAEWAEEGAVWPTDPAARAVARSAAAEMHSAFPALRSACPMDIRARVDTPEMTDALAHDIQRVDKLFQDLRGRFGEEGDFLCGAWSAVDAFYTPVVTRFRTYGLELSPISQAYADTVLADPVFQTLEAEAEKEPWFIRYTPDGRSSGYLADTNRA